MLSQIGFISLIVAFASNASTVTIYIFNKNFLKKNLFTYGYEYFSYGKVLKTNKIKFKEVPVSMDYPSKKNYTKIRPIIDWFIMANYWVKGIYDSSEL